MVDLMTPIPGPFNNFGVPGAKSFHFVAPGYGDLNGVLQGTANPYFARMASSPVTIVIGDARPFVGDEESDGPRVAGTVGEETAECPPSRFVGDLREACHRTTPGLPKSGARDSVAVPSMV